MNLQKALNADRQEDLQEAAASYEKVIANGDRSLNVLLNLAILYWQATDVGLAAAQKLTPDFLALAGRRFTELLIEAERRFPKSTEVRFWRQYIAWVDLGETFNIDECRLLLREDPENLLPALYLFSISEGKEAKIEAHKLLQKSEKECTTRARYIISVIQGVMKRTDQKC